MATKKSKLPTFTVQMRITTVVDIELETESLESAIAEAKSMRLMDIISYGEGVTENEAQGKVVAAFGDWGMD